MNNACPECGAVYAVADKDIGKKISCKKCSANLVVAEEGLIRTDDDRFSNLTKKDGTDERARARDRDDEDRASRRRSRDDDDGEETGGRSRDRVRPKRTGPGAAEIVMTKLKGIADAATWIYGIGLVITIYSFFAPRMDSATLASREGRKESSQQDFNVYDRSINKKPDDKAPSADETKNFNDKKKEWEKRTLPELEDDIAYARAGGKRAEWWNTVYRMIGFLLLAFGSIAYLKPEQTQLRRVLGGVTILLILLQIVGGGVGMQLVAGGPRGG